MNAPLDEARLRKAIDVVKYDLEKSDAFRSAKSNRTRRLVDEDAINALLDALSAERERGDKAVGLIEDFAQFGVNHTSRWVSASAQDLLATQKAEGAE